ncbi:MAG: TauD/TfdA family dioxygenase [Gammaproteobacteria bacterium]|nr:TauD/TfdA family dioxygenase [Gammaproteobacteria bacterium]
MNANSPFDLNNTSAYESWKEQKLKNYPEKAEELIIEINNPHNLSFIEKQAITKLCKKTNMAVYVSPLGESPDKDIPFDLAKQFGLHNLNKNMGADDDGITALRVQNDPMHKRYIPYTTHAIHWHTDGYYNSPDQQIMALNLHCVRPAKEGGENAVMDHDIAYIQLRDENPDYIEAFMQMDAMTIPENVVDGELLRPERAGPVFSVRDNGLLHMRYTARAHNVIWKNNEATKNAVAALDKLLKSDNKYIYRLTLQPGWGLISNNVLHDRSGFTDDEAHPRLLYRSRYYDSLLLD